jgi:hypothetical protein
MAVKNTVSVSLTDAYQNLATLVDGTGGKIPIGTATANKVLITILSHVADIAWGETIPPIDGHDIGLGDTWTISGLAEIKNAWLRNSTAGSTATAIITAFEVIE